MSLSELYTVSNSPILSRSFLFLFCELCNFLMMRYHAITREQSKDTGMAVVLLLLLAFLFVQRLGYVQLAVIALVLDMVIPGIYRPVAFLWLGMSNLLGMIVPRLVLALVFFLVVTPVGLLRRMLGKDPLQLKAFKQNSDSVLVARNHTYESRDLEKPF